MVSYEEEEDDDDDHDDEDGGSSEWAWCQEQVFRALL